MKGFPTYHCDVWTLRHAVRKLKQDLKDWKVKTTHDSLIPPDYIADLARVLNECSWKTSKGRFNMMSVFQEGLLDVMASLPLISEAWRPVVPIFIQLCYSMSMTLVSLHPKHHEIVSGARLEELATLLLELIPFCDSGLPCDILKAYINFYEVNPSSMVSLKHVEIFCRLASTLFDPQESTTLQKRSLSILSLFSHKLMTFSESNPHDQMLFVSSLNEQVCLTLVKGLYYCSLKLLDMLCKYPKTSITHQKLFVLISQNIIKVIQYNRSLNCLSPRSLTNLVNLQELLCGNPVSREIQRLLAVRFDERDLTNALKTLEKNLEKDKPISHYLSVMDSLFILSNVPNLLDFMLQSDCIPLLVQRLEDLTLWSPLIDTLGALTTGLRILTKCYDKKRTCVAHEINSLSKLFISILEMSLNVAAHRCPTEKVSDNAEEMIHDILDSILRIIHLIVSSNPPFIFSFLDPVASKNLLRFFFSSLKKFPFVVKCSGSFIQLFLKYFTVEVLSNVPTCTVNSLVQLVSEYMAWTVLLHRNTICVGDGLQVCHRLVSFTTNAEKINLISLSLDCLKYYSDQSYIVSQALSLLSSFDLQNESPQVYEFFDPLENIKYKDICEILVGALLYQWRLTSLRHIVGRLMKRLDPKALPFKEWIICINTYDVMSRHWALGITGIHLLLSYEVCDIKSMDVPKVSLLVSSLFILCKRVNEWIPNPCHEKGLPASVVIKETLGVLKFILEKSPEELLLVLHEIPSLLYLCSSHCSTYHSVALQSLQEFLLRILAIFSSCECLAESNTSIERFIAFRSFITAVVEFRDEKCRAVLFSSWISYLNGYVFHQSDAEDFLILFETLLENLFVKTGVAFLCMENILAETLQCIQLPLPFEPSTYNSVITKLLDLSVFSISIQAWSVYAQLSSILCVFFLSMKSLEEFFRLFTQVFECNHEETIVKFINRLSSILLTKRSFNIDVMAKILIHLIFCFDKLVKMNQDSILIALSTTQMLLSARNMYGTELQNYGVTVCQYYNLVMYLSHYWLSTDRSTVISNGDVLIRFLHIMCQDLSQSRTSMKSLTRHLLKTLIQVTISFLNMTQSSTIQGVVPIVSFLFESIEYHDSSNFALFLNVCLEQLLTEKTFTEIHSAILDGFQSLFFLNDHLVLGNEIFTVIRLNIFNGLKALIERFNKGVINHSTLSSAIYRKCLVFISYFKGNLDESSQDLNQLEEAVTKKLKNGYSSNTRVLCTPSDVQQLINLSLTMRDTFPKSVYLDLLPSECVSSDQPLTSSDPSCTFREYGVNSEEFILPVKKNNSRNFFMCNVKQDTRETTFAEPPILGRNSSVDHTCITQSLIVSSQHFFINNPSSPVSSSLSLMSYDTVPGNSMNSVGIMLRISSGMFRQENLSTKIQQPQSVFQIIPIPTACLLNIPKPQECSQLTRNLDVSILCSQFLSSSTNCNSNNSCTAVRIRSSARLSAQSWTPFEKTCESKINDRLSLFPDSRKCVSRDSSSQVRLPWRHNSLHLPEKQEVSTFQHLPYMRQDITLKYLMKEVDMLKRSHFGNPQYKISDFTNNIPRTFFRTLYPVLFLESSGSLKRAKSIEFQQLCRRIHLPSNTMQSSFIEHMAGRRETSTFFPLGIIGSSCFEKFEFFAFQPSCCLVGLNIDAPLIFSIDCAAGEKEKGLLIPLGVIGSASHKEHKSFTFNSPSRWIPLLTDTLMNYSINCIDDTKKTRIPFLLDVIASTGEEKPQSFTFHSSSQRTRLLNDMLPNDSIDHMAGFEENSISFLSHLISNAFHKSPESFEFKQLCQGIQLLSYTLRNRSIDHEAGLRKTSISFTLNNMDNVLLRKSESFEFQPLSRRIQLLSHTLPNFSKDHKAGTKTNCISLTLGVIEGLFLQKYESFEFQRSNQRIQLLGDTIQNDAVFDEGSSRRTFNIFQSILPQQKDLINIYCHSLRMNNDLNSGRLETICYRPRDVSLSTFMSNEDRLISTTDNIIFSLRKTTSEPSPYTLSSFQDSLHNFNQNSSSYVLNIFTFVNRSKLLNQKKHVCREYDPFGDVPVTGTLGMSLNVDKIFNKLFNLLECRQRIRNINMPFNGSENAGILYSQPWKWLTSQLMSDLSRFLASNRGQVVTSGLIHTRLCITSAFEVDAQSLISLINNFLGIYWCSHVIPKEAFTSERILKSVLVQSRGKRWKTLNLSKSRFSYKTPLPTEALYTESKGLKTLSKVHINEGLHFCSKKSIKFLDDFCNICELRSFRITLCDISRYWDRTRKKEILQAEAVTPFFNHVFLMLMETFRKKDILTQEEFYREGEAGCYCLRLLHHDPFWFGKCCEKKEMFGLLEMFSNVLYDRYPLHKHLIHTLLDGFVFGYDSNRWIKCSLEGSTSRPENVSLGYLFTLSFAVNLHYSHCQKDLTVIRLYLYCIIHILSQLDHFQDDKFFSHSNIKDIICLLTTLLRSWETRELKSSSIVCDTVKALRCVLTSYSQHISSYNILVSCLLMLLGSTKSSILSLPAKSWQEENRCQCIDWSTLKDIVYMIQLLLCGRPIPGATLRLLVSTLLEILCASCRVSFSYNEKPMSDQKNSTRDDYSIDYIISDQRQLPDIMIAKRSCQMNCCLLLARLVLVYPHSLTLFEEHKGIPTVILFLETIIDELHQKDHPRLQLLALLNGAKAGMTLICNSTYRRSHMQRQYGKEGLFLTLEKLLRVTRINYPCQDTKINLTAVEVFVVLFNVLGNLVLITQNIKKLFDHSYVDVYLHCLQDILVYEENPGVTSQSALHKTFLNGLRSFLMCLPHEEIHPFLPILPCLLRILSLDHPLYTTSVIDSLACLCKSPQCAEALVHLEGHVIIMRLFQCSSSQNNYERCGRLLKLIERLGVENPTIFNFLADSGFLILMRQYFIDRLASTGILLRCLKILVTMVCKIPHHNPLFQQMLAIRFSSYVVSYGFHLMSVEKRTTTVLRVMTWICAFFVFSSTESHRQGDKRYRILPFPGFWELGLQLGENEILGFGKRLIQFMNEMFIGMSQQNSTSRGHSMVDLDEKCNGHHVTPNHPHPLSLTADTLVLFLAVLISFSQETKASLYVTEFTNVGLPFFLFSILLKIGDQHFTFFESFDLLVLVFYSLTLLRKELNNQQWNQHIEKENWRNAIQGIQSSFHLICDGSLPMSSRKKNNIFFEVLNSPRHLTPTSLPTLSQQASFHFLCFQMYKLLYPATSEFYDGIETFTLWKPSYKDVFILRDIFSVFSRTIQELNLSVVKQLHCGLPALYVTFGFSSGETHEGRMRQTTKNTLYDQDNASWTLHPILCAASNDLTNLELRCCHTGDVLVSKNVAFVLYIQRESSRTNKAGKSLVPPTTLLDDICPSRCCCLVFRGAKTASKNIQVFLVFQSPKQCNYFLCTFVEWRNAVISDIN